MWENQDSIKATWDGHQRGNPSNPEKFYHSTEAMLWVSPEETWEGGTLGYLPHFAQTSSTSRSPSCRLSAKTSAAMECSAYPHTQLMCSSLYQLSNWSPLQNLESQMPSSHKTKQIKKQDESPDSRNLRCNGSNKVQRKKLPPCILEGSISWNWSKTNSSLREDLQWVWAVGNGRKEC